MRSTVADRLTNLILLRGKAIDPVPRHLAILRRSVCRESGSDLIRRYVSEEAYLQRPRWHNWCAEITLAGNASSEVATVLYHTGDTSRSLNDRDLHSAFREKSKLLCLDELDLNTTYEAQSQVLLRASARGHTILNSARPSVVSSGKTWSTRPIMAGVPSSRGCDYCRRQKQKCDEAKPQCRRCKRLKIPCVGAGQVKFKFKPQSSKYITSPWSLSPEKGPVVVQMQGSESSRLAHRLVQDLQVKDPRYNLGVYGVFLAEIPQRLGSNSALDAAVNSFSSSLLVLHSKVVSDDMRAKYVEALAALRMTLDDPALATTSSTLCAVFLLVITQLYLGIKGGQATSHSRGVLQIIKHASLSKARSEFDLNLLKTLSAEVIFDSLFNPAIQLDEHFYQLIESWEVRRLKVQVQSLSATQYDKMSRPVDSLVLRNLARLSPAVHQPPLHIPQLRCSYQQTRRDLALLQHRVKIATKSLKRGSTTEGSAELTCLILHQTMYGILLGVSLLLNSILIALRESPIILTVESAEMCQDVLELARGCYQYRPLGSSYMPLCLMVACAVSDDSMLEPRLLMLLEDWRLDFLETGYVEGVHWLRTRLQDIRDGREAIPAGGEAWQ